MHTHASFYFWSRTTKGLKIWYSFNMILCWKVRDKRLPNKHTHTHKSAHTHTHTHHTHTHTYTHTPTRTWKYGVAYFSIFIWKIEKEREKNVACHDSSKAASKILLQTSSMAFYLLLTSGALLCRALLQKHRMATWRLQKSPTSRALSQRGRALLLLFTSGTLS